MQQLSEAIKEAYALTPSNETVIETIAISHPSITNTLYFVKQREQLLATLETSETVIFEPVGFDFTLPSAGENGKQELKITIDNVDRAVSDFINQAKDFLSPVMVVYRPYLASDLSAPQMDPPLILTLTDVSVTLLTVSARASFADVVNRRFPKDYYTTTRFPSLGY